MEHGAARRLGETGTSAIVPAIANAILPPPASACAGFPDDAGVLKQPA